MLKAGLTPTDALHTHLEKAIHKKALTSSENTKSTSQEQLTEVIRDLPPQAVKCRRFSHMTTAEDNRASKGRRVDVNAHHEHNLFRNTLRFRKHNEHV